MVVKRIFIFLLSLVLAVGLTGAKADKAQAGKTRAERNKPLKIHMISGSKEYESAKSLPAFKKYLEKRYHVVCTMSLTEDKSKDIPNIEKLDEADVMLVFSRRLEPPERQLAHIKKWCEAGKPVVGVRTASHAFQGWLEFDKVVLGGDYQGHGDEEKVETTIEEKAKDHPILKGVEIWERSDKMYRNPGLAKGVRVLMTGKSATDTQPLAWARVYNKDNKGRAFYTSMGNPRDFENDNFRKLLVNAVNWTTRGGVRARNKE